MKIALVSLNKGTFPPGGLVYVATSLKSALPWVEVEIIDINYDDVYGRLMEGEFDLIGIGAMTVDFGKAIKLAERLKQKSSKPIIIGGVHISVLPSSLKPCFDVAVIGEGERTMQELVELYEREGEFSPDKLQAINGLAFFRDGQVVRTEPREPIERLDDIPIPNWSLVNRGYFRRRATIRWGKFGVRGSLLTSRGCPYKCTFCSSKRMWGRPRFHSPQYVVRLVKDLVSRYNVSHIQIWDDLFAVDKKRLRRIAVALEEEKLTRTVEFSCTARTNLIDDEMCEILRTMNVKSVCFGIESGSERVLQSLKTGQISVEDNRRAVELCTKHEIESHLSIIFGSPGEKIEDMRETLHFLDFAIQKGATYILTFIMTPYPQTEMWEIAKNRGKVYNDMDWELLSLTPERPLLLDEDVDLKEFQRILSESRAKARRLVWSKKVPSFIKSSPGEAISLVLKNPFIGIRTLLGRY